MTTTKTSLLALTAAFLAHSAPAQATDILTDPSSAYVHDNTAAPHSWTGLWLGAVGGYQFSNSAVDFSDKVVDEGETVYSSGLTLDGLGAEGLFGEAQIGFDKQIGQRTVVGIFGGYNITDAEFSLDGSRFIDGHPDLSGSANLLSFEQEWGGVLGVRAGVLKSQDTLLYVAGGWAFGELGDVKSEGAPVFENQETDLSGWFGEVGMESRVKELGDNVYVTVAGRYTDYSAITLDSFSSPDSDYSSKLELDHDTLAVMVGLKAKLGGF